LHLFSTNPGRTEASRTRLAVPAAGIAPSAHPPRKFGAASALSRYFKSLVHSSNERCACLDGVQGGNSATSEPDTLENSLLCSLERDKWRFLVAGGAGYIDSHIVHGLLE
jgi:hypothetical protein